jgi:hypothetical protein
VEAVVQSIIKGSSSNFGNNPCLSQLCAASKGIKFGVISGEHSC